MMSIKYGADKQPLSIKPDSEFIRPQASVLYLEDEDEERCSVSIIALNTEIQEPIVYRERSDYFYALTDMYGLDSYAQKILNNRRGKKLLGKWYAVTGKYISQWHLKTITAAMKRKVSEENNEILHSLRGQIVLDSVSGENWTQRSPQAYRQVIDEVCKSLNLAGFDQEMNY